MGTDTVSAEPDWLTSLRETLDAATAGGPLSGRWVATWTGQGATSHASGQWDVWRRGSDHDQDEAVCCLDGTEEAQADAAHIAAWCPDNARRLLAEHDRIREQAAEMADAMLRFVDDPKHRHHQPAHSPGRAPRAKPPKRSGPTGTPPARRTP